MVPWTISLYSHQLFSVRESLQASADILQHNLRTLLDIVTQHNDLFTRVAVHPSTNYPGRTQEGILFQLLRKKADPDVANSMDEGRKTLANLAQVETSTSMANGSRGNDPSGNNNSHSNSAMLLSSDPNAEQDGAVMARIEAQETELEDIWSRAQQACHERVMRYAQDEDNDPYTAEEREMGIENVRTGLRRPLESDDEDDDDDEEDEDDDDTNKLAGGMRGTGGQADDDDVMIIDRPPPPPAPAVKAHDVDGAALESILRFGARGEFFAI